MLITGLPFRGYAVNASVPPDKTCTPYSSDNTEATIDSDCKPKGLKVIFCSYQIPLNGG